MKKLLFVCLLGVAVFLTGCDPVTNDDDDQPNIPNDSGDNGDENKDDDEDDDKDPFEDIDASFILPEEGWLEGNFEGEELSYYFRLEEETSFVFSLEAEFDTSIVIRNIETGEIVFEVEDSLYGNDIYTNLVLGAGDYIVLITSEDSEGAYSISIGETSPFLAFEIGTMIDGDISEEEINAYRIDVEDEGYYRILSFGDIDLQGVLTSFEGEMIAYGDDVSEYDLNFELIVYLEEGQYLLNIGAFYDDGGNYQVMMEHLIVFDALVIMEDTSVNGVLASGQTKSIEVVVERDGFVELFLTSDMDSFGELYNESGVLVYDNDDVSFNDYDFGFQVFLEAGTYRLDISSIDPFEGGHYSLTYNFTLDQVPIYAQLSVDVPVFGSLDTGVTDVYELVIEESITLDIYSESSEDMYGELYNASGELLHSDDDSGENSNFLMNGITLEPGTYYLHISNFFGSPVDLYTLYAIESLGGPSAGDQSFEIEVNQSMEGNLSSGSYHTYTFTIESDGYVTAYTVSDMDTSAHLVDIYDNVLYMNDDEGPSNYNFKIDHVFLEEGTYSIVFWGYSDSDAGDYVFYLDFEEERAVIRPNSSIEGYLDNDTIETVTFTLERAGYIHAYLESDFDSNGSITNILSQVLLTDDDSGDLLNFSLSGLYLSPGQYSIHISGFTSGEYGHYELFLEMVYGSSMNATYTIFPYDLPGTLLEDGYNWYSVEVTEAGYVTASLTSDFDSYGYLLDEDGVFVWQDDDTNGNGDFYLSTWLEVGVYSIVVCGATPLDSGDYILHTEITIP